jgi:ABC-type transport system involved in multi-copper enzyme maturation permease subunit
VIRATLRTITARRGSFRGGALVVLVAVLLVIGVLVVVHELRPGRNPSVGGQPMLDGVGGAVWALGTVVAILIGALAGSYDVAQGTMRYLVLTGVGRLRIYLARTVAVVGAVLLALVPALALGLIAVFVLPSTDADKVTAGEVLDVAWTSVLFPLVFALIAMGIGTLLRSNGPAIAVSLLFVFAGAPLLALIEAANETIGDLMLLQALDRLTGGETSLPIAVAGLAAVAWVTLFWALGGARLARDEY